MNTARSRALRLLLVVSAALVCWGVFLAAGSSASNETKLFGKVTDAQGNPVEGAMVFAYRSRDVRRTAEFISAPTGKDGSYRLSVTPGMYWLMARVKQTEGFGPLTAGDRHSGDPVEVDIAAGAGVIADFVVLDLKDAMQVRRNEREAAIRLSGRIIDEHGAPVPGAYAIAGSTAAVGRFPEFLSASTDAGGRYVLYLPRGRFYLGAATTFPPESGLVLRREIDADADRQGMDIVLKKAAGR